MPASTRLITYEDSLTMPEDRFEEIVNGEIRRLPPASDRHGYLLKRLQEILERQLRRDEYVVLPAGFGLGIQRRPVLTYRVPDLTVFRVQTLKDDRNNKDANDPYIWKPPELVVECLSPANQKGPVEELIADYERIGVPELWLLDPKRRVMLGQTGQTSDIASARLPGISVDLADPWQAFDLGLSF